MAAGKRSERLADRRRAQLATIHIARAQLGMDEETYRSMLRRVSAGRGAEVDSAADLSADQRADVIRELQRLGAATSGASSPGRYPGKPANFAKLPGEITKIEAQLADMKLSWAYADAIAGRMFGIAKVGWLRKREQLIAILAALEIEQGKRGSGAEVDKRLAALDLTEPQLVERLDLPPGWRRSVKALQRALDGTEALMEATPGALERYLDSAADPEADR